MVSCGDHFYICRSTNVDMRKLAFIFAIFFLAACGGEQTKEQTSDAAPETPESKEVNVYSHRHYDIDQTLFKEFESETGIKVNVVNASADELIVRLETEGEQSPADLLLTSDAGRLVRAEQKGLLQPVESATLLERVPTNLRADNNTWFGLTKRARVLVYHPDRVDASELSTYKALADEKWKGRLLARSSSNIYMQSLLASIIANSDYETAVDWATDVRNNMARDPKGNDRAQVKAIAAGEGDVAIVNTYYIGKMLNSENEVEKEAGEMIEIFFPNQDGRGTHINVSGGGVTKYAPNKENAIKLLEFLTRKDIQERFADGNYEYPVNPEASASELLKSWGEFKEDPLPLKQLGLLNGKAVEAFAEANWD